MKQPAPVPAASDKSLWILPQCLFAPGTTGLETTVTTGWVGESSKKCGNLDLASIARRSNLKPVVCIQNDEFLHIWKAANMASGKQKMESLPLSGIFGPYAEKTVLLALDRFHECEIAEPPFD